MASPAKSKRPKRRGKNPAGRPTAAELERRKQRVIKVATRMFVSNGYAATTLVDIAKGAGVATRTLYQHFGDKEAIFREVVVARDEAGALARPAVEDGDTLFDALSKAARYAHDVISREQSVGLMRLMIAESARFPDFMTSIANSIFSRFRRNIEKVFVSLEQAKAIPKMNHARSAELFADIVLGSHPIMIYTNWETSPLNRKDISERVDLFIKGRFDPKVAKSAKTKKIRLPKQQKTAA